jgi:hypothetical protein
VTIIDIDELDSPERYAVREMQLAHIRECHNVQLQWIFKTSNLEIARVLASRICTVAVIVMNGELCVGVGFLIGIEPASWKIYGHLP